MSTPRDVVIAALATPIPDAEPDRPNVEARADLIVAALIEHGHLPGPERPPLTEADVHEGARWLADACRHPRYAGDGWTKLLQSESDVTLAMASAAKHGPVGNDHRAVAAMLLDWQKDHPYDHGAAS